MQAQFPDAVRRLNRDLELAELQAVFDQLTDVGPGVDGVSPVVLRFVEEGICMDTMLGMFQRVFDTGVQPESWRNHRMLFHYKGKNEDPYCLANYRVLGIDHLLLKIWSLLMVERLDEFIRVTKGLSVLQGGFSAIEGVPNRRSPCLRRYGMLLRQAVSTWCSSISTRLTTVSSTPFFGRNASTGV